MSSSTSLAIPVTETMILFDVQLEEWVQKSSKNHEYIQKEKGIPASAYFLLGSFASDGDIHVGHASKCPVHLSALQEEDSREMSSRPKRLRLSCRKVCELWFPDDETNPDECDAIGDNPMQECIFGGEEGDQFEGSTPRRRRWS
uniref:Uncharacterized protein n=2 Tax=Caenorhabditis japonica TaxID=281687 RepID=A0A8R1DLR8_CAEJA